MDDFRYHVKGYSPRGELLLHTKHKTEASRDMEISVWQGRKDVGWVDVFDAKTGEMHIWRPRMTDPEPGYEGQNYDREQIDSEYGRRLTDSETKGRK